MRDKRCHGISILAVSQLHFPTSVRPQSTHKTTQVIASAGQHAFPASASLPWMGRGEGGGVASAAPPGMMLSLSHCLGGAT